MRPDGEGEDPPGGDWKGDDSDERSSPESSWIIGILDIVMEEYQLIELKPYLRAGQELPPRLLDISQTITEEIILVALRTSKLDLYKSGDKNDFVHFLERYPQDKGFANLKYLNFARDWFKSDDAIILPESLAFAKRCPALKTLEIDLEILTDEQDLSMLPSNDGSIFAIIKSSGISDCKMLKLVIIDGIYFHMKNEGSIEPVFFEKLERWLIKGFMELVNLRSDTHPGVTKYRTYQYKNVTVVARHVY
ncbi:hypothetical protein PtrSN002B_002778 [Pyrenophora tritici-repentis]|nr:hypothetical protein TUN205_00079 [Pyrenophora tritici-repentis]KAI1555737.1 hypothetical protein PtrSN002B_002778 [Pyrenophora tritici-repentis]KAI2485350.1 hypothetical protein Ptr902_04290 [Pyrenophora tritici-repentis]PWO24858.1 phytanoyl-CoA dioxygenase [Pyrenophora tritici-repentis]